MARCLFHVGYAVVPERIQKMVKRSFLITVDEITSEDLSPCDSCGCKFKLGDSLMLIPNEADDSMSCRCLDCVEAM